MVYNVGSFYVPELLAPCPTPPAPAGGLSIVGCSRMINICVANVDIVGCFFLRNLCMRHSVVTGTELSRFCSCNAKKERRQTLSKICEWCLKIFDWYNWEFDYLAACRRLPAGLSVIILGNSYWVFSYFPRVVYSSDLNNLYNLNIFITKVTPCKRVPDKPVFPYIVMELSLSYRTEKFICVRKRRHWLLFGTK